LNAAIGQVYIMMMLNRTEHMTVFFEQSSFYRLGQKETLRTLARVFYFAVYFTGTPGTGRQWFCNKVFVKHFTISQATKHSQALSYLLILVFKHDDVRKLKRMRQLLVLNQGVQLCRTLCAQERSECKPFNRSEQSIIFSWLTEKKTFEVAKPKMHKMPDDMQLL